MSGLQHGAELMGVADEASKKSETHSSCLRGLSQQASYHLCSMQTELSVTTQCVRLHLWNQGIPKSVKTTISLSDLLFATGFRLTFLRGCK